MEDGRAVVVQSVQERPWREARVDKHSGSSRGDVCEQTGETEGV